MFFFLMPAANLESRDSFILGGLDLRYDVIVQPKNADGKPGPPLVPKCGHSTLDCNDAGSLRIGSHNSGFRFDDLSVGLIHVA